MQAYQQELLEPEIPTAKEVIQQVERINRLRELENKKAEEEKQLEEARKNSNFTQVYPKGWDRIISLSKGNSSAAALYAWFAQHLDPSCGAVVCDQQFLADQFNVTPRTIRNWLKYLEEHNAIIKIPVAGRVYAYALDPHEVWKGYNTGKNYSAFTTKTLVNKEDSIQRRIQMMMAENKKKENTSN